MVEDNQHLWDRFIALGDRIGMGDLDKDDQWMVRDYKRLMKILCPPTEEEKVRKTENRQKRNKNIDSQIKKRLETDKCFKCSSELKQTRSGSKVVQCINEECRAKWQYKAKKQ